MNYWAHKEELAAKARNHTQQMDNLYSAEIQECINASQIYTNGTGYTPEPKCHTSIVIEESDAVSAIRNRRGKTCVLNFASYKNPGGMFIKGSSAQEESLCHASFLYNVLSGLMPYYNQNRQRLNQSLYLNRAIYTPDVFFFSDGKTYHADVLTCAAPNKSAAQKFCNVSDETNKLVLTSRIDFMLSVAALNNPDTLVLGAFGCGVFGQNPEEVANIFKLLLNTKYKDVFSVVAFAIPDASSDNFQAFYKVFAK